MTGDMPLDTVGCNTEETNQMHPTFKQLETWLRAEALASHYAREARDRSPYEAREITIRLSTPDDRVAILRLAELDSRRPPAGDALLAVVDGDVWAALPLGGGEPIANPFRPTAKLIELLRLRDAAMHDSATGRQRRFRLRMALAER
jgi:hypothetical protein